MSDAVRVTHCTVIREARKEGGAQHGMTARNLAALAAPILTLRGEPDLIFEPSGERLFFGDWRPVGWIRAD